MSPQDAWALLVRTGAVVSDGHFVYKSGLHGRDYIRKRSLLQQPHVVRVLVGNLAHLAPPDVEVVVGPEKGGMVLAPWVAGYLSTKARQVRATFAERAERVLMTPDERGTATVGNLSYRREPGDHILVRHQRFVLKYEAAEVVKGKRVLVVDDIVTSGMSLRETVEAVRREGGTVIGVVCVYNRGGITAEDLGVEYLASMLTLPLEHYAEHDCPLCKEDVPVNTDLGYGQIFLDRRYREREAQLNF